MSELDKGCERFPFAIDSDRAVIHLHACCNRRCGRCGIRGREIVRIVPDQRNMFQRVEREMRIGPAGVHSRRGQSTGLEPFADE